MFTSGHSNFFILAILISVLGYFVTAERNQLYMSDLRRVQLAGEIKIITRNTPTTYYIGPQGPTGFEYELAYAFAKYIGVEARIVVSDEFASILPSVGKQTADFAAAGITVTQSRQNLVDFSSPYQTITQLVVYKAGNKKPRKIEDLKGQTIHVIRGSSHEELLKDLAKTHAYLRWQSHDSKDITEILEQVEYGKYDCAISDSNDFQLNQRIYPALREGFKISNKQSLAWAFPLSKDKSLVNAANAFLAQAKSNGLLDKLYEKHYSHVPGLNYAGAHTFHKHINSRLENLIPIFKRVADQHDIDWRFLAAVSYQESLWNPGAVSPTGVRGLMMLTQNTARQLGIANRTDPFDSTQGGAAYLLALKKRIPERIGEPDRTWMALAAYNIGPGHLEDARVLTQTRGGNPDRWADVREALPLLTQQEWHKKTKFGYARGHEPVLYVRNIRNYYDLLVWKYKQEDSLRDTITRIIPRVL